MMILIKSPDGVDDISLHHPFLIQCPKTKLIHVIKKQSYGINKAYYIAIQSKFTGAKYITNNSILANSDDKRYYFTDAKLRELIEAKNFTIAGFD